LGSFPGWTGFVEHFGYDTLAQAQVAVYEYDWFAIKPPLRKELEQLLTDSDDAPWHRNEPHPRRRAA
jgi:hypothetical protein